ncbi:MAG TPA: SDR family oxidoreductase [Gemmatimonadaceae bacterium]|nr:SDR family oxidoreductase [Gemmatimonadaceae bacterium]
MKPLDQQVMVITGASSGIGLATALVAAEGGAKLILNARSEDTLQEVVADIRSAGGDAEHVAGDVADRIVVQRIANAAISRFGRIDTWVNDAGVSIYGRITETSEEDNRRLFDTNFWGVVNGSLVALPHLRESRGALINVGSEVSEAIVPLQGMYSASKHAVKGFTDALRVELKHDEIPVSVTLIQPGATDTPFPQHARNYMDREPALPTPLDDPFHVAEKILEAATSQKRAIKVSAMAKMNVAMAKFAPAIGERMAAKQMDRQQYDEPPRNPRGSLHAPSTSGRVYGTGGRRAKA